LTQDLATKVRQAAAESDLVRAVAAVRRDGGIRLALGEAEPRRLRAEEVTRLERLGNAADDWSRLWVVDPFDPDRVRNCRFHGDVFLGRFAGAVRLPGGPEPPAGVYDSTLARCVVGHDALVCAVRMLAGYVVGQGALLFDCGTVACTGETAFGNGAALRLGPETGGREVGVFAEIDVETAAAVARPGPLRGLLPPYAAAVADYRHQATSGLGIIERGACVRATPTVRNTYIGAHALVDGVTLVADSTLLSSADEPTRVESGACVEGALLQWGSRVSTLAIVQRSVLTEYASAERHAKVAESLLGPNTSVGAGEVTSSLVGPSVGCHHQSLLIATLWPGGRGNVAYGANVGSNHTGRAPDQECWAGEGVFFGLGVTVKFPADYSRAPYTVVASGLTLPPQRLTFPFSLLTAPSARPAGVPESLNEIIPAWALAENWFALERAQVKQQKRDRARRTRTNYDVFRPEIIDLMRDACRRLESVPDNREVYTERQVDGLGKNFLREASRTIAIEAYRFATELYALLGLKQRLQAAAAAGAALDDILRTQTAEARWEHQRTLLREELGASDAAAALGRLPDMLERVARGVELSRAKDDERGVRVLEDYAEVHPPASRDDVVTGVWERTRRLQGEIKALLGALGASRG
jgi:hypothetical protein